MNNQRINPEFLRKWKYAELSSAAKAGQITAEQFAQKLVQDRDIYIGGMAVAFMDATGLPIEQIRLCIRERKPEPKKLFTLDGTPPRPEPVTVEYWFERKEPKGGEKANG